MQTSDYISKDIKALSLEDTVKDAQNLFNRLTFTHIPVVDNDIYLGSISEADVSTLEENEQKIDEIRYLFDPFFADENPNWFDLLKDFAQNETSIIPVVDSHKKYAGYFELSDILNIFNETPFLFESGAILVVSKNIRDYSFSEITQIVESNNGKIFGCFISKINGENTEITIKMSTPDLNNTIQTFRRYEYSILTEIHEDEYLKSLKERSDYLQKYLNI